MSRMAPEYAIDVSPDYFKVFALLRFHALNKSAAATRVLDEITSSVPSFLTLKQDFLIPVSLGFHYNELSRLDDDDSLSSKEFDVIMLRILQCVVWQGFARYFPQFDPDASGLLFENFEVSSELLSPAACSAQRLDFGYDSVKIRQHTLVCLPLTVSVNDFLIGPVAKYVAEAYLGRPSPVICLGDHNADEIGKNF